MSESAGHEVGTPGFDLWRDRRASLRKHLVLARRWEAEIRGGLAHNAADVARREDLSRASVCQVMALLRLAPAILEEIEDEERRGPIPPEKVIRKLAGVRPEARQVERFQKLCREEGSADIPAKAVGQVEIADPPMGGRPRVRCRGYAKAFAEARRLRAMLDTGAYPSIRALGREVGITGERVAQLLNLLQLAPEIIEILEGPGPYPLDSKQVRRLAAIRGWEGQRELIQSLESQ